MSAPKISILVPCLNARQFLEPRIDSILAQTHGNWEAIVLDSHSNDGSWEFFQSLAAADARFQLYQVPREGVYAALNRGVQLATGEFLGVATCDDTMAPEFLTAMLQAFAQYPEAGIAVCDARLIDRHGNDLSADDVAGYLSPRAITELLEAGAVRTAFPRESQKINYRPPPHDCLLHFNGRSVYFSLTQVLVRSALAKTAAPFDTGAGSIADFGWLLCLTNITGTVHLPEKLATWRFHGDQLSIRRDQSRLALMQAIYERALPEIYERHRFLLTRNDCATLLLPGKASLANSFIKRVAWRLEAVVRVVWMLVQKPVPTVRAIRRARFRIGTLKQSLLPMMFDRLGLAPRDF